MSSKLKMKFGQVEFEIESDSDETIARERNIFLTSLPQVANLSYTDNRSDNNVDITTPNKALSIKSDIERSKIKTDNINIFIKEKGFSTDIDKVLAVAYFAEIKEGIENFDSNDIKERMLKAKLTIPNNISLPFNRNAQKGYIQEISIEEKSGKRYYVTDEGKDYIEFFVKKEVSKKKKSSKKTQKS